MATREERRKNREVTRRAVLTGGLAALAGGAWLYYSDEDLDALLPEDEQAVVVASAPSGTLVLAASLAAAKAEDSTRPLVAVLTSGSTWVVEQTTDTPKTLDITDMIEHHVADTLDEAKDQIIRTPAICFVRTENSAYLVEEGS